MEPEHSEVAAALSACPEFAARVCALQTLKGLLQLAYPGSAAHGSAANRPHKTGSHD